MDCLNLSVLVRLVLRASEMPHLFQPLFAWPSSFTWTVQFSGLGSGDVAGLRLYGPPVVGAVRPAYWLNPGGTWALGNDAPGNFAAQFDAVNRGAVLMELGTVTNAADCGQAFTVTRTWQAVDD